MSVFDVLLFGALAGLCVGIYAGVGWERYRLDVHYVEKLPDDPFLVSDSARKARMNKMPLIRFKVKSLALLAVQVVLVMALMVFAFIIGAGYVR